MKQEPPSQSLAGYALSSEYNVSSPRINVRRVFKITLYFAGVVIAEFGLLGGAVIASGSTNQVGDIALVIGVLALIGSLFIFFRKGYSVHCLSWKQYLLWILGATTAAILAFVVEFAFVPNLNTNDKSMPIPSAIFGGIIVLYGIALVGIAHKKPPLRQQVSESVQRILKSTPGKQIPQGALIARLQKEYPYSDTTLTQYLGMLEYLEQLDISETPRPAKEYRIKGTEERLAFPEVHSITNPELRQKILRALQFLNEDNIDIGLFLLSKEFEATLKEYLMAANTKGELQTLPPGKTPDKWTLNGMVDCAKENGIISDHAVFHYLRQARNDRAHGTMPSLAERRLLLKNVQYIAGLYIDYIKLLDDLTHTL